MTRWRAIEGSGVWEWGEEFEWDPYYDESFATWYEAQRVIQKRLKKAWQHEDCATCAHEESGACLDLDRIWFEWRDKHVEPPDLWTWNIDGADWVIVKVEP